MTLSRKLGVSSRDGASLWAVSLGVSLCAGSAVGVSASIGVFTAAPWYAVAAILGAVCLLAMSSRPQIFQRLLAWR